MESLAKKSQRSSFNIWKYASTIVECLQLNTLPLLLVDLASDQGSTALSALRHFLKSARIPSAPLILSFNATDDLASVYRYLADLSPGVLSELEIMKQVTHIQLAYRFPYSGLWTLSKRDGSVRHRRKASAMGEGEFEPSKVCGATGHLFAVIAVTSHPSRPDNRQAIRQTWAATARRFKLQDSPSTVTHAVAVLFFVCINGMNSAQQLVMQKEADERDDVVFLSTCTEGYPTASKGTAVLTWLAHHTHVKTRYIIRVDDDIYLRPLPLLRHLDKQVSQGYVWGLFAWRTQVPLDPDDPHAIRENEFPMIFFPPYPRGPLRVISRDVVLQLVRFRRRLQRESPQRLASVSKLLTKFLSPEFYETLAPSLALRLRALNMKYEISSDDANFGWGMWLIAVLGVLASLTFNMNCLAAETVRRLRGVIDERTALYLDAADSMRFAMTPTCVSPGSSEKNTPHWLPLSGSTPWLVHHVTPRQIRCMFTLDERVHLTPTQQTPNVSPSGISANGARYDGTIAGIGAESFIEKDMPDLCPCCEASIPDAGWHDRASE
eukprot:GHVT01092741.1.p1 GENE.GHVT01092741.1~~GHVT01092741.1.p1  ORF type:complete len:550 (-),score=34.26 GHVT01092741.1:1158-2807(-)